MDIDLDGPLKSLSGERLLVGEPEASLSRVRNLRHALPLALVVAVSGLGQAQDTSVDIDLESSRRIGGRGLTESDKRAYDRSLVHDDVLSEENLPGPGEPRRMEGLHKLGEQYVASGQWPEACVKYDLIVEEGGREALEERDRALITAGRAYLGCAKDAYSDDAFERAEHYLTRSEDLMGTTGRHRALRWKMLRDEVHEKVAKGDLEGAFSRYSKLQEQREDEDERLWFGEQLALAARAAHDAGDAVTRDRLVELAETVAPMNVELRQLQSDMNLTSVVARNIVIYGVGGMLAAGVLIVLSRWRSRARVGLKPARRRKNPFLDDEDEVVE